jgi:hypothetical protein
VNAYFCSVLSPIYGHCLIKRDISRIAVTRLVSRPIATSLSLLFFVDIYVWMYVWRRLLCSAASLFFTAVSRYVNMNGVSFFITHCCGQVSLVSISLVVGTARRRFVAAPLQLHASPPVLSLPGCVLHVACHNNHCHRRRCPARLATPRCSAVSLFSPAVIPSTRIACHSLAHCLGELGGAISMVLWYRTRTLGAAACANNNCSLSIYLPIYLSISLSLSLSFSRSLSLAFVIHFYVSVVLSLSLPRHSLSLSLCLCCSLVLSLTHIFSVPIYASLSLVSLQASLFPTLTTPPLCVSC